MFLFSAFLPGAQMMRCTSSSSSSSSSPSFPYAFGLNSRPTPHYSVWPGLALYKIREPNTISEFSGLESFSRKQFLSVSSSLCLESSVSALRRRITLFPDRELRTLRLIVQPHFVSSDFIKTVETFSVVCLCFCQIDPEEKLNHDKKFVQVDVLWWWVTGDHLKIHTKYPSTVSIRDIWSYSFHFVRMEIATDGRQEKLFPRSW